MNALKCLVVCCAAVAAVAAHELGKALVRAAEAWGVEPDGLARCPDLLPEWVDDGSATW